MTIRVARVPYLSCEPFYHAMKDHRFQLCDMAPRDVGPAAARGEVEAGPVSPVDSSNLEDRLQPLGGFCLSCADRAGSVLLYSTRSIEELQGARIGVINETSTSFFLLQVLLALKYRVRPGAYVPLDEPNDAILLIGTQALRRRGGVKGYPHRYDLGTEWHQWTALPFVFSRWMVRKDLAADQVRLLEDALFVGLEDGVDALYELTVPRKDLLMMPRDVVDYIDGIRYYLGVAEQRSMDLFQEYLAQIQLREPPD